MHKPGVANIATSKVLHSTWNTLQPELWVLHTFHVQFHITGAAHDILTLCLLGRGGFHFQSAIDYDELSGSSKG